MNPAKRHAVHDTLLARLAAAAECSEDTVAAQVRPPPKPEMGDYAFPCFEPAKQRQMNPAALAAQLAGKLAADEQLLRFFEPPTAAGPFVNFRARPGELCAAVLGQIALSAESGVRSAESDASTLSLEGAGRTIVIDYSSPNIAKPFHVGHLMGTILGGSLVRIFRRLGYTVVGVNHLGDWGTQCGYQFLAWQQADPQEREKLLAAEGLDYLADLYVEINAPAKALAALEEKLEAGGWGLDGKEEGKRKKEEADGEETTPARGATSHEPRATSHELRRLEAEAARLRPEVEARERAARELFRRLEEGDPELRALWERFRRTTLDVLQRSYDRLGVRFESDAGEGFYEPYLKPLIEELKSRGVLVANEGAWVIPLSAPGDKHKKAPFIVVKSDGATKYETRDLAAAIYRKRTYDFAQNLYVVDVRQSGHFQGLFRALEKCGYAWARDCHHVSYGIMKVKEGDAVLPMTTRGGRMIPLHELLDRMVQIVRGIVEEKNPELPPAQKDVVAEAVGVGAIVFWVQSRRRDNNVLFDWRQATNPDGDTGPYVQYTHARACSILRKAGGPVPAAADLTLLRQPEEAAVAKALERFPAAVALGAASYEPSLVATWLVETARFFNDFYQKHQVLKAEPRLRDARLVLVDAARVLLAEGLRLLGVAAPEEM